MNERFGEEELKVIRIKRLQDMLGISRSTIYSRIDSGSKWFDPDFPKPFKIGGYAVGWDVREVMSYVENKKRGAK